MANEVGFHEVNTGDVEELLNSHGESLTTEYLIKLEQQRAEEATKEDQSERVLTCKILWNVLNKVNEALDLAYKNDPDLESSTAVKIIVLNAFSCDNELYKEKKITRQLSLDSFFKRKQPEPAPDTEGGTYNPTTSPSPEHPLPIPVLPHQSKGIQWHQHDRHSLWDKIREC